MSDPLDADQVALLRQLAALAGPEQLGLLVGSFTGRARELASALRTGSDPAVCERAAHELAGAAGTIGAPVVAGLARELELRARGGRLPHASDVAELDDELARAAIALDGLLAGRS